MRMSAQEIAKELASIAPSVAQHLLPNGKRDGKEWKVGSVFGEAGCSMGVCISGEKAGVWTDFATGEGGDLLNLWVVTRGLSMKDAIQEAKQFLGIREHEVNFVSQPKKYDPPAIKKFQKPASMVADYLISDRKLTQETIDLFQVGESGTVMYFPYIKDGETVMLKQDSIRRDKNGKRIKGDPMGPTSSNQKPILFGWQALKGDVRRIIITEGEIDAMTWTQLGQPALSVPFGGGVGAKHQWLENELDDLEMFDEIILAFDNDEAGEAAAKDLINRIGQHRCRVIEDMPCKDINEALQRGLVNPSIAKQWVEKSRHFDPVELTRASVFTQGVIDLYYPKGNEPGFHSPWQQMDGKFLFRPAELTIISGVNGHGKSEVAGHILLGAMKQGWKACVASMELQPVRLLHRLTAQICGVRGSIPSEQFITQALEWTEDKLWIFNLTGTAKADRVLEVFEYAHRRYGINLFVIDSLMKCGLDEEDNTAVKLFIEKVCDFKNKYGVHVLMVTHQKKGETEDRPSGKMDVKGTGAITDLADSVLIAWRNKPREKVIKKQDHGEVLTPKEQKIVTEGSALIQCVKQRNGDWEGGFYLWFCRATRQYLPYEKASPICYIPNTSRSEVSYG